MLVRNSFTETEDNPKVITHEPEELLNDFTKTFWFEWLPRALATTEICFAIGCIAASRVTDTSSALSGTTTVAWVIVKLLFAFGSKSTPCDEDALYRYGSSK